MPMLRKKRKLLLLPLYFSALFGFMGSPHSFKLSRGFAQQDHRSLKVDLISGDTSPPSLPPVGKFCVLSVLWSPTYFRVPELQLPLSINTTLVE